MLNKVYLRLFLICATLALMLVHLSVAGEEGRTWSLTVRVRDDEGAPIHSASVEVDGELVEAQEGEVVFESLPTATYLLKVWSRRRITVKRELFLDDHKTVEMEVPNNLLDNPRFEKQIEDNGKLHAAFWDQGTTYGSVQGSVERSHKFSRTGGWAMKQLAVTSNYGRHFISEPVRVQEGKTYQFGGWAYVVDNKNDSPQDFRRAFRAVWLDEKRKEVDRYRSFASFGEFESWEKHFMETSPPPKTKFARFKVESRYSGESGTQIFWDDMFMMSTESD